LEELGRLCASFRALGEPSVKDIDRVSSIGERLSARILAATLRAMGTKALAVDATDFLVTDAHHGEATPMMDATRENARRMLLPMLEKGTVPVVTGYIGATVEGEVTTLGRGGGDYTAALVGACLDSDEVWIWTDVDGIMTADPKLAPEACSLGTLSYREALELAYFGAEVLHPKTVTPLAERGIPLHIKNSFAPRRPGTRVVKDAHPLPGMVKAIVSTKGLGIITVAGGDDIWMPQLAARTLSSLSRERVNILMFSQPFSDHSIRLIVRGSDAPHSVRVLRQEFAGDGGARPSISSEGDMAIISVVGARGRNGSEVAARVFEALGKRGADVVTLAQGQSEFNLSFIVREEAMADAVRRMHKTLNLGE